MANTAIATTHGLTLEQWQAKLYETYQEKTFFGRFKGTDENSVIQVKRELTKSKGDAINFGLAGTLTGAGVTGNNPLSYTVGDGSPEGIGAGNEEAMVFYDQRVTIDQIRNGVRIAGAMDEQRVAFSLREQAKGQLTTWMANNEDAAIFTAINTCSIVDISASHTAVTLDSIVSMKKEAMFPTSENISTGVTSKKIRPITLKGGEEVFVLGLNPTDAAALKVSDDFKEIHLEASQRGDMNPIFTGALGVYNGVIIHEHSDFVVAKPVLLGAQAAFLAYSDEIVYGEEEFDYGNQTGFMIGSIRGVELAVFNDGVTNAGSHGAIQFDITA